MSARRRFHHKGEADLAARPWCVFLTDRRKAGSPIKLAAPFPFMVTESPSEALTFETEAESLAWCEKAKNEGTFCSTTGRGGDYTPYVMTPGRFL